MGLNEVFAAGWGTNAVKANLDDVPPKHKSCMTTQFGSVAFKGCTFENEDEGCFQKRPPPQDSRFVINWGDVLLVDRGYTVVGVGQLTTDADICFRCPGIMKAVLKQHPRLDKVMVHWGRGKEPTKCYLPETHGRHGWCKTKGVI